MREGQRMRARLNKSMAEALRQEAQKDLLVNINERALFGPGSARPEVGAEYEKRLLACADILGALNRATSGWGVKGCALETAQRVDVDFSDAAVAWLEELRHQCRASLEELSLGSEGDLKTNAEDAYLIHVVDHCLWGPVGAQAA
jgi:hypothetical protein